VLASVAVVALVRLPAGAPFYGWFFEYWGAYRFFPFGRSLDPAYVTRLYLALPAFLFALPTVLMGFSFPALQRAVHDEARTSGRKVGALQAANIVGCVAGSLLVGLVSLDRLGTAGTLRLLPVLGLAFAAVGWRHYGRAFAGAAVLLLAATVVLPDNEALWRRLHGVPPDEARALFEEDATGVVAVVPEASGRWRLAVNGKGNSWLPYGGVHTALGALPAVIHPAPRAVAVIGLGSGDTVWAAACRNETETVTVFEISSPQPRILRRLVERQPFAGLGALLQDPRVLLRLEDGRHALAAEGASYDLIEADAIWPESAYSGNLYSEEFFAGCARRLREGGVMCTWAPTPRVHATFARVFPHVLAAGGGVALVGSREPLDLDVPAWTARLEAATAYLGPGRARAVEAWLRGCARAGAPPDLAPNRDLFPRDEFAIASARGRRSS
jgi:spermidine synthase